MAQNDNFVSIMNIRFQQYFLLEWRPIDEWYIFESWDWLPNSRINLVSSSLVLFSCDNYNSLKLVVLQVLCSERHYEMLDGGMNAAHYNVVLEVRVVFEGGLCHIHKRDGFRPHVVVFRHLLVIEFFWITVVYLFRDLLCLGDNLIVRLSIK